MSHIPAINIKHSSNSNR